VRFFFLSHIRSEWQRDFWPGSDPHRCRIHVRQGQLSCCPHRNPHMHRNRCRARILSTQLNRLHSHHRCSPTRPRFFRAVQRRLAEIEHNERVSGSRTTFIHLLHNAQWITPQVISHFVALVLTTVFLLDNWAAGTMWYIFGFFVAPISACEALLIISSLFIGKKKY
jgi:hypothetical protein